MSGAEFVAWLGVPGVPSGGAAHGANGRLAVGAKLQVIFIS